MKEMEVEVMREREGKRREEEDGTEGWMDEEGQNSFRRWRKCP